ncbi:hypothetical protein [Mycobacterium angelicum]|nr:hypothetical protein [Mycobacterium angelicum]MCV7197489.1 hypothetical protein [Mycobacterium angelicum]
MSRIDTHDQMIPPGFGHRLHPQAGKARRRGIPVNVLTFERSVPAA